MSAQHGSDWRRSLALSNLRGFFSFRKSVENCTDSSTPDTARKSEAPLLVISPDTGVSAIIGNEGKLATPWPPLSNTRGTVPCLDTSQLSVSPALDSTLGSTTSSLGACLLFVLVRRFLPLSTFAKLPAVPRGETWTQKRRQPQKRRSPLSLPYPRPMKRSHAQKACGPLAAHVRPQPMPKGRKFWRTDGSSSSASTLAFLSAAGNVFSPRANSGSLLRSYLGLLVSREGEL